jgi:hypothetical protein
MILNILMMYIFNFMYGTMLISSPALLLCHHLLNIKTSVKINDFRFSLIKLAHRPWAVYHCLRGSS